MMQLKVLGCSGGIGQGLRTSSYLIDEDILLDAGTGVGDLSLVDMRKLKHIFITHSHMDHVTSLPLLVDTLFSDLERPLIVHARPETLKSLQQHVFNWEIWPDFTELPTKESAVLSFQVMRPGETIDIDGRSIEMIDVNHTVPAAAYAVKTANSTFAYSGDTTTNDNLWHVLNGYDRLDFMVIESAFANHDIQLAQIARHYCPELLAKDLTKLTHQPRLGISHLKPGEEKRIMEECKIALDADWDIHQLSSGDSFTI
ncbi:MAG: 3',5'-cyclic-nucleotide phosphodiesterase [Gammaproteobacteria bacterium]|nr:3',5'-cyclic-nucleotide phosphodiesterase [Gammaproteobacteria bacterium]